MKYQIIIRQNGPHRIEATLISRFMLFWLFPIWVEEDVRNGSEWDVRNWVAHWRSIYNIPFENVADLTEVKS